MISREHALGLVVVGLLLASPALSQAGGGSEEAAPTYGADVQPILEEHCVRCHQPGEVAPMSLQSFDEVRPWARSIVRQTQAGRMPPWFADAEPGVFANDSRLSEAELETLSSWVKGGAPKGLETEAPAPERSTGWRLGTPDVVLALDEPYPVPASGEIDYVFTLLDTGQNRDRWLRGVEVLPGEPSVIHHVDVMLCRRECRERSPLELGRPGFLPRSKITEPPEFSPEAMLDGADGDFLFSHLPGGQPMDLAPGSARLLPAGSALLVSYHYTATGEAQQDHSRIGLFFTDEPPKRRVLSLILDNQTIWIPAGAENYTAESRITLGVDAELLALTPHMHFRGRASEVVATLPGGERRRLLSVPRYDFNWQITYEFAESVPLPAGTRISVFSTFDNSAANPFNPDPSSPVPWGRQSWDEMSSAFVELSVAAETDLEQLVRWPDEEE